MLRGFRRRYGLRPFQKLTREQKEQKRAELEKRRAERDGGFFKKAHAAIKHLVMAAEDLFPKDGKGPERKAWVIDQAVKLIKTPAGDALERAVVSFIIELIIDENDEAVETQIDLIGTARA